jgi:predicted HD phosphohydrolase
VVAALCHDIGKLMSIPNHGAIAAEILKPYVSGDLYWAIKYHQDFQGKYYYEHLGMDKDAREQFRGEPWFDTAEKLVDRWDAPAFDPSYTVDSLESFEPDVIRVFSKPKRTA